MDTGTKHDRIRILFVDDEENVLKALQRVFIDEDYEILTAQSGEEGLEILKTKEIAVIVSDQRMPGMSGAEFLEQAGSLSPDSARLILTGHADMNTAIDAINKGGAQRYITKPWKNDDLISTLHRASERYRLIKENRYLTELTNRQNEELKKWSAELEMYVQEQTVELTYKTKELADMNATLERNFRNFVITISNLIELRDNNIANHSNNVAIISEKIAEKIGLNKEEIQNIKIAAQLHDIGKIGIPDAILLKDIDALAPFEELEYKKHSVRGQVAVDSNDAFREAGVLIRHHHESYDGKGFPDGLSGDKIPLGSRIIAIADRFDRLLLTRVTENALNEIKLLSGRLFDPHLFHLLAETAGDREKSFSFAGKTVETELHPDELLPTMVLSRDIRSGTGLLLISKGVILNPKKIDSIKRYYNFDPPNTGVFVWRE